MQLPLERRSLRPILVLATVILAAASFFSIPQHAAQSFTFEQIKSYPFPNELTASATGSRIAWAFNERGARNVWVAEGPDFKARRLTNYETRRRPGADESFDSPPTASTSFTFAAEITAQTSTAQLASIPALTTTANEGPDLECSICRWRTETSG